MVIRGTLWTCMAHWRWDVTLGHTTFRIFMAALICPPSLAIKSCCRIQGKKKPHHICGKHFPTPFLCPADLCWLSWVAFRDEKLLAVLLDWNEPPFKSIFGKCTKEPLRKFMVHQTPRLEWPHSDWDTTTDACVPLSLDSCACLHGGGCIFTHQNDSTTGF